MKKQNTYAFTLVELVVVITILAILGTIGFLSISGYAQKARNSNRVYDMKVIEKALSVYIQTTSLYPNPDNATAISYSGGIAWSQGIFWSWALSQVGRVSTIPVDPLTKTAYAYSVLNNRTKYQIGGITEGGLFSSTSPLVSSSYALSSPDLIAHTLGNFVNNDVPVMNGWNCSLISAPSIILSDIPAGWVLNNGSSYRYSYTDSPNIPSTYSGIVVEDNSGLNFQTVELLHSCSIETLGELELYIAQLSTAYQSLSSLSRFQNLVFNSNTAAFELETISNLQNNGITIAQSLIDELHAPLAQKVFTDIFSDTDGVFVVGGHTPNSASWSWLLRSGGDGLAYSISANRLIKNGVSNSLIYPLPEPIISLADYKVSFDIQDFAGGNIRSYLRYSDANNYYELILSASGYQVNRRLAGVDSVFQNISDPIALWSTVSFSIAWDTLVLTINGIEKENILAGWLSSVWNALLLLENNTASIDNYSLTYK